jgi:hypothetical protein
MKKENQHPEKDPADRPTIAGDVVREAEAMNEDVMTIINSQDTRATTMRAHPEIEAVEDQMNVQEPLQSLRNRQNRRRI